MRFPITRLASWTSSPLTSKAIRSIRSPKTIVRLNKTKKQHSILVFDEAQLLSHPALEQIPLLLNFDMDSSTYRTLLLIGQPLLRRTQL